MSHPNFQLKQYLPQTTEKLQCVTPFVPPPQKKTLKNDQKDKYPYKFKRRKKGAMGGFGEDPQPLPWVTSFFFFF
jgi:hypothetical protein